MMKKLVPLFLLAACASHGPHHASPKLSSRYDAESTFEGSNREAEAFRTTFAWPVREPTVLHFYGWRKRRMHEGIDLRAHYGTPILAAASGKVVYAGRRIRGYGKMVTIRHNGDWNTVYAHLSQMRVRVGDQVRQGQVIGISGNTGRSRGAHLHFEVRNGADPLDPMLYLPERNGRPSMLTRRF